MHLDEIDPTPLYQQIFNQIRQRIDAGDYAPGTKLPSIRGLADTLQCARNTVDAAYSMLVSEGFAVSKPGSGFVVANVGLLHGDPASAAAPSNRHENDTLLGAARKPRFDFTYGNLEPGTVPAAAWRSITDDILMSVEAAPCNDYGDPLGETALRDQIAWRLATQRSVDCDGGSIVIQAGTADSVVNLLSLLDRQSDVVAMEEPGYPGVRDAIVRSGFAIAPCRIGEGYEHFMADLEKSGAKLVYVTPSSQFPTCAVMPVKLPAQHIAWAAANDADRLADDYCRDFRYRERPLPPLQSMDRCSRVIYMGTFSKSLSPALRINYLVLPPLLLARWKKAFGSSYPTVPWLSQAVLARFMADGSWDRHLRRLQARNMRKHRALVDALDAHMGNRIGVLENGTGLHLLVSPRDGRSQEELITTAAASDVRVYGTRHYWTGKPEAGDSSILVGFSAIALENIEPGVKTLAEAWFS